MNLKELSQLLGLSQTTVSRALNGYPEVNEETRRRVMQAAREHGYQPNAAARRLATGKANAIGCVAPGAMAPQFLEFLAGVAEQAGKEGLDVVLASADGSGEETAYRRLASHGQVDAILLFAPDRNDPRLSLLSELDLPFIVYGRSPGADGFAHLDFDEEAAFHNAARLLAQLGHRAVALMNGPKSSAASAMRENGARRALKEAGLDLSRALAVSGAASEAEGYEAARQLLDADPRPTGVLCASLFAAKGLERAAAERGLAIGADLSVIAHDDGFDFLDPDTFATPLTTMRAPLRKAGRRIAERLSARIKGLEKGPKAEVWQAELVVRASIAPPSS